jgi:hypothetical protein
LRRSTSVQFAVSLQQQRYRGFAPELGHHVATGHAAVSETLNEDIVGMPYRNAGEFLKSLLQALLQLLFRVWPFSLSEIALHFLPEERVAAEAPLPWAFVE